MSLVTIMESDTVLRKFARAIRLGFAAIVTDVHDRFFNQPRKDALIQGPKKKYPMVTGGEFTANAMSLYYAGLKAEVESAVHIERVA